MNIEVYMPQKIHEQSQYTCEKMLELSTPQQIEVAFMYGGTYALFGNTVSINLESFHIPKRQDLQAYTFDIDCRDSMQLQQELEKKQKFTVGVGHSHSNFGIFHSDKDLNGLKSFTFNEGFLIPDKTKLRFKKIYASILYAYRKWVASQKEKKFWKQKVKDPVHGSAGVSFIYNGIRSDPEYKFTWQDDDFNLHLRSIKPKITELDDLLTEEEKKKNRLTIGVFNTSKQCSVNV